MKRAATKRDPSGASLREIPEVDFSNGIHPHRYAKLRTGYKYTVSLEPDLWERFGSAEEVQAAQRLAALGHPTRLAEFGLLVRAGLEGMSAGAIGERFHLPAATLSFHRAHVARVGPIAARPSSRFIYCSYCSVDLGLMELIP